MLVDAPFEPVRGIYLTMGHGHKHSQEGERTNKITRSQIKTHDSPTHVMSFVGWHNTSLQAATEREI